MPLSAVLDGETVISVLMADEAWARAKTVTKKNETDLLISSSKLPGFARTSSLGLRHFAHRRGYTPEHQWAETAEHLMLKAELVKAIAAQDWAVSTEVASGPEREWVADVLAERDGRRIAFEVQWSDQSAQEYVRRTQRYAAAGIECVWLIRKEPELWGKDVPAGVVDAYKQIPIFKLREPKLLSNAIKKKEPVPEAALCATIDTRSKGVDTGVSTLNITGLVSATLNNKLAVQCTFPITVYAAHCWKCVAEGVYWEVDGVQAQFANAKPEQDPLILAGVVKVQAERWPHLHAAKMGSRYSATAGARYLAFLCPACNQMQGDFYKFSTMAEAMYAGNSVRFEVPASAKWQAFIDKWQIHTESRIKLELN